MLNNKLFVVPLLLVASSAIALKENQKFPDDFLFGIATAAFQVEGAWDEDKKGENIWDHFIHENSSRILNKDNADIACDSYHKYAEDIGLAKKLGVSHYRFSVSWSRILPTGVFGEENTLGIAYYKKLVAEIVKQGMIPVATLYHWDLPQPLQDLGGWMNPDLVKHFVEYSRVVIRSLDQVGYWITINEPKQICRSGYGNGVFAPGITLDGLGEYLCAYVVAKAHAAVYHMYKEEFPHLTAKMSITLDGEWSEPASDSQADVEAANRRNLFEFGLYANPIFKGDWPQTVIERVKYRSDMGNYTKSRLPQFTNEEIAYINGTYDFMGFNTYWTNLVADTTEADFTETSYANDIRAKVTVDPSWPVAPNGNTIVPWGARKFLKWVKDTYNDPEIFITENGVADNGSTLEDEDRINFHQEYLTAILEAIHEDKVKIFGYTIWSLLDNFEWTDGYSSHFGLYSVDFNDPERPRTAKKSVSFYQNLISTKQLPDSGRTSTSVGTTSNNGTSNSSGDTKPEVPTNEVVETNTHGSATRLVNGNIFILVISVIYLY